MNQLFYTNVLENPNRLYITEAGLRLLRAKLSSLQVQLEKKRVEAQVDTDDEWVHHNEAARDARLAFFRLEDEEKRVRDVLSMEIVILKPSDNLDFVDIGNAVVIEYLEDSEEDKIIIVGQYDRGANESFISYSAPIAQALLGHKVGEKISFSVGESTTIKVKIKSIEPASF